MTPTPRAVARLLGAVLHLLRGLAIIATRFPRADAQQRQRHIQHWARGLLARLGVDWQQCGSPLCGGGTLLVANHVSWLDILAIHAACPAARFVSKADVKRWPLVGRLVEGAGTLFIERERKRDAMRVVHHVAEALARGETVALFPEGTTSDGAAVLPLHANLLQAAIAAGAPVQPLLLHYREAGRRSTAAPYVGDDTLVGSVWRIARARGLQVQVSALAPLDSRGTDRRALSARLHAAMSEALQAGAPAPAADR